MATEARQKALEAFVPAVTPCMPIRPVSAVRTIA